MRPKAVLILFLVFSLRAGANFRLMHEELELYRILYPKKYPSKGKIPLIISVSPERDVDFFLGKWNEFVGHILLDTGGMGFHGDSIGACNKIKHKYILHQKYFGWSYYPPYALIPRDKRIFEVNLLFGVNSFKREMKKLIRWGSPYWYRIRFAQGLPILVRTKIPFPSPGVLNLRRFALRISGIVEKYEDPMSICKIMDVEEERTEVEIEIDYPKKIKREKKREEKRLLYRTRELELEGKCVEIREELNEKGEIKKFSIRKISTRDCHCIPELARLYDGVNLEWEGAIQIAVKKGKIKFAEKKLEKPRLKRRKFFHPETWRLKSVREKGKICITLYGVSHGKKKSPIEASRNWKVEELWGKEPKVIPSLIKSNSEIPPAAMRDILLEVEIERGGGEKEKALVYLYQLGSPKGGLRLTWFDWAQVIEGEGEIELCEGDTAPALMFDAGEGFVKPSVEFCLKGGGEIEGIRITRIRASNYAGQVWEEKVNLPAKVEVINGP